MGSLLQVWHYLFFFPFFYVNDWCVNVHPCSCLCFIFFIFWSSFLSYIRVACLQIPDHFFLPSPASDVLQEYSRNFLASFFQPLMLYVVPSVAWGENGIEELHVVGYVYQELLVCTANFTYMQWVCLHYTVCVCCIHIYNILNKIFI